MKRIVLGEPIWVWILGFYWGFFLLFVLHDFVTPLGMGALFIWIATHGRTELK